MSYILQTVGFTDRIELIETESLENRRRDVKFFKRLVREFRVERGKPDAYYALIELIGYATCSLRTQLFRDLCSRFLMRLHVTKAEMQPPAECAAIRIQSRREDREEAIAIA